MASRLVSLFAVFVAVAFLTLDPVECSPAIATGYDQIQICLDNCVQCRAMLGAWFEGPLCAESCLKLKGKVIPECEDFASIAPFLNKLNAL
ncbi:eclosion hormone domain-containing protein [Phthorimaea operculella]|nr:eclosion hormone domain-containing protein [Phthorimaea operculella]